MSVNSPRLLALSVAICALGMASLGVSPPAFAARRSAPVTDYFHQGLGHQTQPPAWARGKAVHFMAAPGQGPVAEIRKGEVSVPMSGSGEEEISSETDLSYFGGPVQQNPHVHLVYWGSNWNQPGLPTEIREALGHLYSGISGSAWQGILTQYFEKVQVFWEESQLRLISKSIAFEPTVDVYTDTSLAAPTGINYSKINSEIEKASSNKSWSRTINDQYVVLPAPGFSYESGFGGSGFCAFHWAVNQFGPAYAFVPPTGGCGGSPASISVTASHEYAEAVTNPIPSSVYFEKESWDIPVYSNGHKVSIFEIADICGSKPDGQLENGAWVESLHDNYKGVCTLADASPPQLSVSITGVAQEQLGHATLKGQINPAGYDTGYRFRWGKMVSGSCKSEHVAPVLSEDIGSGIEPVSVSQPVAELEANVQYCATVEAAVNINGGSIGSEERFESEPVLFTVSWAPKVTTKPATDLNSGPGTEATLSGTVNPQGLETTYQFEYGPTEAYGSSVPVSAKAVGSGTGDVNVSNAATGLLHSTTYHYRIRASNSNGVAFGQDQAFTTLSRRSLGIEAEKYTVSLAGSQQGEAQRLTLGEGSVTCSSVQLSGSLSTVSREAALQETASGCKLSGVKATLSMNSCHYNLHVLNAGPPYAGSEDVACSKEGDAISISAPSLPCTVTIPPQNGLKGIELANSGSGSERALTATYNLSGITYKKEGVGCPEGAGTKTNGGYTGTVSMLGFK